MTLQWPTIGQKSNITLAIGGTPTLHNGRQ